MDFFSNLSLAFHVAMGLPNLIACFLGVLFGTMVGVLPGLGPTAAISLLLPITFKLSSVQAVIMLAGIYYGAQYGGSITSILVNIPGEASTVVTCLDGYQMARQGRAGAALGISAFGSFIGGTFAIIMLMLIAPALAEVALKFGAPEMAALVFFGLTMVTYLSSGPIIKSLIMATLGILLGFIGTDIETGLPRFTLGMVEMAGGLGLVPVAMGLFGIAEVMKSLEEPLEIRDVSKSAIKGILPTKQDWKDSAGPIARGSVLGFLLGLIPGGGALISSLLSYAMEKRISKHPERFGKGAIEGVAGPETANNAGAGGAFVPLLSLGIPTNVVLAVLVGALMIHKITPGPLLVKDHPELFWGVVGSMYIGNVMLLILNIPLIGLWVRFLKIPYGILFPFITLFCLIGAYTVNNTVLDIYVMMLFGLLGYGLRKFGYEPAPFVLAFVLGPMFEEEFRRSLVLSDGSFLIFFSRPISATFIIISLSLLLLSLFSGKLRRKAG